MNAALCKVDTNTFPSHSTPLITRAPLFTAAIPQCRDRSGETPFFFVYTHLIFACWAKIWRKKFPIKDSRRSWGDHCLSLLCRSRVAVVGTPARVNAPSAHCGHAMMLGRVLHTAPTQSRTAELHWGCLETKSTWRAATCSQSAQDPHFEQQ